MRVRTWLFALLALLAAAPVAAHGGRLDRNGGHYNRRTGVYHCHRCPCGCGPERQALPAAPAERRVPAPSTSALGGRADVRVWVNTNSGVYHCPGTRWYGATKRGEYMTQKQAQGRGNRPAYGNVCR
jgi:hypothetical protein